MSTTIYLYGPLVANDRTCPHCGHMETSVEPQEIYSADITGNLVKMAAEAGLYNAIWNPKVVGITKASHLAPMLLAGITQMVEEPARFIKHNPANGWGSYDQFVEWCKRLHRHCEEYPNAEVSN